jgi:hypothetical protein
MTTLLPNALQRTQHERRDCNRCVPRAGSVISLGSPAMRPHSILLIVGMCFIGAVGCSTPSRSSSRFAQLLATNAPCHVRLDPAWLGAAVYTVRTGFFTNADPEAERLDLDLRFDWFQFPDKASYFHLGPRTVSRSNDDGRESAVHTWRASFPSDGDLMAASSVSSLEKLLGPSQSPLDEWGGPNGEMHSSASWSFFKLRHPYEIETFSIFCMATQRKGDAERRVDSIQVIRGRATAGRP